MLITAEKGKMALNLARELFHTGVKAHSHQAESAKRYRLLHVARLRHGTNEAAVTGDALGMNGI